MRDFKKHIVLTGTLLATTLFGAQPQELSVDHGVKNIGFILESDLGAAELEQLTKATKGKVLNVREVEMKDQKLITTGVRVITLRPTEIGGRKALQVKLRNFTGLQVAQEKQKALLDLAEQKTVPFQDAETYKQQTESEASAGKVYETYAADDPNAPERCYDSSVRAVLSMKDTYGREYAGSYYQCNDWIRRVEQTFGIQCRRSWEPNSRLSTYGCHCLM